MTIRAAIVGATGYTGGELIEILARHPSVTIAGLFSSPAHRNDADVSRSAADAHPHLRCVVDEPIKPCSMSAVRETDANVVFLAAPHEASSALAPALLRENIVVVDLSGAFRLRDTAAHNAAYGFDRNKAALARAVYGLPELTRSELATADLIACAGCYATATILALAPLVRAGALDKSRISVCAISGVSGAGRTPTPTTHFCEVSLHPYTPLTHRHAPEIEQAIGASIAFTPHLAPFDRGLLATAHAQRVVDVKPNDLSEIFLNAYADKPCVRLLPQSVMPSVAAVRNLDVCDIGCAVDERGVVCVAAAIDNLRKGAAGQAVQCMNIRFGLDETTGLRATRATQGARI